MTITDYQKAVAEKAQIAFNNFFAKEMQKTKEEIFNDAFVINFYTEMKNFLTSDAGVNAFEERHYSRLLKCGEDILNALYVEFLEHDTDFRDWDDIVDFIIEYVDCFE